nr:hypothetical protein [uncultured Schaedlerella sp.]
MNSKIDCTKLFRQLKAKKILIYGTGVISKRLINGLSDFCIIGVVDRVKFGGYIEGIPIRMWDEIYEGDADVVIIASLPQNYNIIYQRIIDRCIAYDMKIYGADGRSLIPQYGIPYLSIANDRFYNKNECELIDKIKVSDAISLDLFDTLVMRKTLEPTDVFDIVEQRIRKKGIILPEFKKLRREAELQSNGKDIYVIYKILQQMSGLSEEDSITVLKEEIACEKECIIPRKKMVELMGMACSMGKKVNIITNMYLPADILDEILKEKGISGYEHIYVSCEYGLSKGGGLFNKYLEEVKAERYLHIGDDEFEDVLAAKKYGVDSYGIKSAYEMLKITNFRKTLVHAHTSNEKGILGLIVSELFNDPFALHKTNGFIRISSLQTFGKVFVAPIVILYLMKLIEVVGNIEDCRGILFGSRDGYLFKKIYDKMCTSASLEMPHTPSWYFMASRKLCLKAGMKDENNIAFLKYYIADKKIEEVLTRSLGIQNIALYDEKIFESTDDYYMENKEEIFKKSEKTRRNYCKYIENCEINPNEKYLFCDLISHGTVQYGLNQLFAKPLHGFYLCRIFGIYDDLEFHSCYQQGVGSEIANPEYVNFLESILTSPESSVEDMDENGNPVMAAEIRTSAELKTVQCIQEGIEEFSLDYMRTLYIKEQAIIEKLPETLLKMCKEVYFTGECKDIKKRKLYEDMHGVYYDIFEENDE